MDKMKTFDELSRRLLIHEEFEHGTGASAQSICDAEAALGLAFPESYRRFLSSFGWGLIGEFDIYGLGADVPAWLDVVKMAACERTDLRPSLPAHLVPVHYEGDGDHICIDTRQRDGNTAAMVFWNQELGHKQAPEKIADDFVAWLTALL
jgi:cell wall assembly regulator SMI1